MGWGQGVGGGGGGGGIKEGEITHQTNVPLKQMSFLCLRISWFTNKSSVFVAVVAGAEKV